MLEQRETAPSVYIYIYSSSQLRAGRRRLLWNSGWRKFAVRAADTCNLRSQLHSRCTPGRLTLVDGGISSITIHRLSAALVSSKPRKKNTMFFPLNFERTGSWTKWTLRFFFLFFFKCDRRHLDSSFEFWVNYSWTRIDFISDFRY